jgi:hypothetical protein
VGQEGNLARGKLGDLLARVGKVAVEEVLDALVSGAERKSVVVEDVLLLLVGLEDWLHEAHKALLLGLARCKFRSVISTSRGPWLIK